MRSLSVGARHSESRGGLASRSWTSEPSASTVDGGGRRPRRAAAARPRTRRPSGTCADGDLEPGGCPWRSSAAVVKRKVSQRSRPSGCSASTAGDRRRPRPSPGPMSGSGQVALVDDVAVDRELEPGAQPAEVRSSPGGCGSRRSPRASPSGVATEADRRRQRLVLPHGRLGRPVGPDHPVRDEVAVVGLVAEVAAVGPVGRAVGPRLDEAVVPPLPDEAALQAGRGLDGVPVLGQRAVAVAHRVRVLAHDQRVPLQPGAGVVHDRADLAGTSGRRCR